MSEILGAGLERPFAPASFGTFAPLRDGSIEAQLAEATALCRETLESRFAGCAERLPVHCRSPLYWFELLRGCGNNADCGAVLQPVRQQFEPAGIGGTGRTVEQFALLQAILQAAPQVADLPVTRAVKLGFCSMFRHMARPRPQWESYFNAAGWRFLDMAQIATLRRFPAGQHDWEVTGLARSWMLKVPLSSWPRLLWDLATRIGGFSPLMRIHLNAWRPNPLMVLEREAERSYFVIAQSMRMQPDVKGLMAYSWFYSPLLREVSPHLAWLRDFFVREGATLVEMEPAPPDYGFMVGSGRRRLSFEDGSFRPRLTLVLWPRAEMLAWAAAHPELADQAK